MSDNAATAPQGRGHTVEVEINGQKKRVPWGFRTPQVEGKAASKLGIEYPGTSRKA